jgi:hypothetical protein
MCSWAVLAGMREKRSRPADFGQAAGLGASSSTAVRPSRWLQPRRRFRLVQLGLCRRSNLVWNNGG